MNGRRTVSLSIRGFVEDPKDVAAAIGVQPTLFGKRGTPNRPGVQTLLAKNYVYYEREFLKEISFDKAVWTIIEVVGGLEKLKLILNNMGPVDVEVTLSLPVRGSDEQEDGSIGPMTMSSLVRIGAHLGICFPEG